ncbi:MAG: hypothetical protein OXG37_07200 [Actinomycetia bacterium]|nr:hypothetical protein [Actinomycetes bacterium]
MGASIAVQRAVEHALGQHRLIVELGIGHALAPATQISGSLGGRGSIATFSKE